MSYKKELEKLNENQRQAVLDDSPVCLVNANVGSGKTTVLIAKILYLHFEKQVPYDKMVVLTFTNKAAAEIKERLLLLEPGLTEEELHYFGTFHSVALYLLKHELAIETEGFTPDFFVMDPDEELGLAEQLIAANKLKIKYKNRLKKRLERAQSFQKKEVRVADYQDDIFLLADLLEEEKKKQNKMNFHDLLAFASKLLAGREQDKCPDWVIVDEVQDSDSLQLEVIDRLRGERSRLFAVGDPNQVIYSWRGSSENVFYQLREKYQAKVLALPLNYRSTSSILEAAKCFLQEGGRLEGVKEPGNKIKVRKQYNAFQEADYLAGKIKELKEAGVPFKEIAIFYRMQNQSGILEEVLKREEIPYEVSLKKTIKDIPVLNWFMKVLQFAVNPKDLAAGANVLADKQYGAGMTPKKAWTMAAEADKMTDKLPEFFKKLLRFEQEFFEEDTGKVEDALIEYLGIEEQLHPTSSSFEGDRKAIVGLLTIVVQYAKEHKLGVKEGLKGFLSSASLYGINILKQDIHNQEDSVKLMTLHASKGLEFTHVFIIGNNYGLIPMKTKDFAEEDEERRLFFVGITRAKEYLELSYYSSPDDMRVYPGASRYLSMIPERLIEEKGKTQKKISLQDMKKMIVEEREKAQKEIQMDIPMESPKETTEEKPVQEKKVRHGKYGVGTVVSEDELMITVAFEDYGEKEFMKAFSELEEM